MRISGLDEFLEEDESSYFVFRPLVTFPEAAIKVISFSTAPRMKPIIYLMILDEKSIQTLSCSARCGHQRRNIQYTSTAIQGAHRSLVPASGRHFLFLSTSRRLLVLFSTFNQFLLSFNNKFPVADMAPIFCFLLLRLARWLIFGPREGGHVPVLTWLMGKCAPRVCARVELAFRLQMREFAILVVA